MLIRCDAPAGGRYAGRVGALATAEHLAAEPRARATVDTVPVSAMTPRQREAQLEPRRAGFPHRFGPQP
ncbi:hypothetical protein LV457_18685 [Mycobacterium sp. MYCO198283]|uniref:hypothetical protein n=1 Tax=Mycobacterium sp. MYCO198283 TaxID=2883505 RepID=UPI001E45468B|nr:hypothetical protein [Mycobacterium sp. MYCO198283]MCG5434302.1 hypothetical protein [Mycobacterium sp. MYCO198283]